MGRNHSLYVAGIWSWEAGLRGHFKAVKKKQGIPGTGKRSGRRLLLLLLRSPSRRSRWVVSLLLGLLGWHSRGQEGGKLIGHCVGLWLLWLVLRPSCMLVCSVRIVIRLLLLLLGHVGHTILPCLSGRCAPLLQLLLGLLRRDLLVLRLLLLLLLGVVHVGRPPLLVLVVWLPGGRRGRRGRRTNDAILVGAAGRRVL